ncbi:MAG TPA: DNA endonuclease SmrA [Spongiibacteraceae bacterium]|nr:DNA endonuclease SmrA [Spongiibacteraceae bacterium]
MSDVEDELFREQLQGVSPLQAAAKVSLNRSPVSELAVAARRAAAVRELEAERNFLGLDYVDMLDPYYPLDFKRAGVQHGVFRKLKQGKYPMDARLDLHRMTVETAREEVFLFIREAVTYDLRNVLIVPGRGSHSNSQEAILKSYVNKWLPEFDEVQAFCSAVPAHGGTGAVYVMLKKSEKRKQENRERFNRGRTPDPKS